MSTKQITIRMPAAKLRLWLRALRLKKNAKRQGTGSLYQARYDDEPAGYCCLGVAQQVISGGVECKGTVNPLAHALTFPSAKWRLDEGVEFFDKHGKPTNDPYLPMFDCAASMANDEHGYTFKEIADAIEACSEGY